MENLFLDLIMFYCSFIGVTGFNSTFLRNLGQHRPTCANNEHNEFD